ncbi:MraY family glycosyltransferase [uncultured Thiodictyon sp.]|uniref:MraY family glycosyltransferase n=1 Tax=uncultured Thiodictyon sp. TaxID=1846217 RepID=UPI0025D83A85|nr:MraY family glycosyltransferase [uncultured Thiodictyon sp.]
MSAMSIYWTLLYAFMFSTVLTGLLITPARALGWVDQPTTRKHHSHPVPLVGGVAMCAAFCGTLWLLPDKPAGYLALLTGMVALALIGAYDDLRHIRPSIRLVLQAAVVLLAMVWGDRWLTNLGDLMGYGAIALASFALPFTLFGMVGIINAFNLVDGLDGLAGGLALIAAGWLAVLCLTAPVPDLKAAITLLALAAVLAGFLAWNLRHPWRQRASVFMGDAGSTLLGFALSWFLVDLSQGERAVMAPITAIWILALPLLDTVAVMIRRLRAGRSAFAADRQHLHHLLLTTGLSDAKVTAILLAIALITGAVGAAARWLHVPEYLQFGAFLVLSLLYYHATTRYWTRQQAIAITPEWEHDRRRCVIKSMQPWLNSEPRLNPVRASTHRGTASRKTKATDAADLLQ